jgi:hypothetical protein
VAKVRMQASKESDGMVAILIKLWKKEGLAGLYAGVSAQIVKSVLASALMFMVPKSTYSPNFDLYIVNVLCC